MSISLAGSNAGRSTLFSKLPLVIWNYLGQFQDVEDICALEQVSVLFHNSVTNSGIWHFRSRMLNILRPIDSNISEPETTAKVTTKSAILVPPQKDAVILASSKESSLAKNATQKSTKKAILLNLKYDALLAASVQMRENVLVGSLAEIELSPGLNSSMRNEAIKKSIQGKSKQDKFYKVTLLNYTLEMLRTQSYPRFKNAAIFLLRNGLINDLNSFKKDVFRFTVRDITARMIDSPKTVEQLKDLFQCFILGIIEEATLDDNRYGVSYSMTDGLHGYLRDDLLSQIMCLEFDPLQQHHLLHSFSAFEIFLSLTKRSPGLDVYEVLFKKCTHYLFSAVLTHSEPNTHDLKCFATRDMIRNHFTKLFRLFNEYNNNLETYYPELMAMIERYQNNCRTTIHLSQQSITASQQSNSHNFTNLFEELRLILDSVLYQKKSIAAASLAIAEKGTKFSFKKDSKFSFKKDSLLDTTITSTASQALAAVTSQTSSQCCTVQ